MIMKKNILLFIIFLIVQTTTLLSQEKKKSWWKENTSISGYVKYLNTASFRDFDNIYSDNMIHNRINFKMYINDNFTFDMQIRNRILWGESLKNPYFKDYIDVQNDIDLSAFLIDEKALLFHSKIDRLSLTYNTGNWEFKIGRQRINWGKTWAWNANDLFNTYNLLDFDYEERPGSDAISILYNYGESSLVQAAYSYGKDIDHSIIALRQQFSIKSYDIQLIEANYKTDIALGLGWEGYIKSAGFKGESTLFIPKDNNSMAKTVVLTSLSMDYFFKNGLMILGSVLYNSDGITDSKSFNIQYFLGESLSARNLMPNKLSFILQNNLQINPASSAAIGIMYMYDFKAVALLPNYSYSIKENWDIDFNGQLFFGKQNDKFSNIQNAIYLRLRYSY